MIKDGTTQAVQIIDYNVEVKHSFSKVNIDFETPYFSEIETFYSDKKPNPHFGILHRYSLSQLLERLNTYKSNGNKDNAPAILKGIYSGGTSGMYCDIPAGYLFFDIDVKDNENPHLKCKLKNANAFEAIQKHALLTWRSNSGLGIAGILYVPQLAEVGNKDSKLHLQIGNTITQHLTRELKKDNVSISFDSAQSKFRQIRFLAEQKEQRIFNPNPATFEYKITETPRVFENGVKAYRNKDFRPVNGSIEDQYNQRNNIKDSLLQCGFDNVHGNRYKHPRTTSTTTGEADDILNVFFNYSGSFSSIKGFSPFRLVCFCLYNNDKRAFIADLKAQGYNDIKPTQEAVEVAKKTLNVSNGSRSQEIFSACYNLQNLPFPEKLNFINENCKKESERPLFYQYLKLKNLSIKYDAVLKVDKYVSEAFSDILTYADEHQKVIVKAETGTGKTYSVITEFPKLRSDQRCLIIAPLTVIVDQTKREHKIVGLTGQSSTNEHSEAKTAKMVIATQEQAIKHLRDGNTFDYIVIDEMHNLLNGNSYKRETLAGLTFLLRDSKVIGLTATPNEVFSIIGYKLLSIEKNAQKRTKIIQRQSNLPAYKIILEHQKNAKGKSIYRINSKKTLHDIKDEIIQNSGFTETDIFLIYSEKHIKQSQRFKGIIYKQQFPTDAKIILTTAIIDEGLNIYQEGFSDVVFIDADYTPRPESLKQFLARFRNEDPNRINYHYRKFKKDQDIINWNWQWDYKKRLKDLTDNVEGIEDFNSYNDLANDGNFYYSDHTINKYYLGFSVTENFFDRLTIAEANEYLRQNYNLDIVVDAKEFESDISTDRQKQSTEKKHAVIYQRWMLDNDREEIKKLVRKYTSKKKLKNEIPKADLFSEPTPSNLADDVRFYLSDFERLISETEKLKNLTNQDPDSFLFEDEKLRNSKAYNRLVQTLENREVIDNPQTSYDLKNRLKILNFINGAIELREFQMPDLWKLWQKQRISSIRGYKSFYLIDLIVDNLPDGFKLTENTKVRSFKITAEK